MSEHDDMTEDLDLDEVLDDDDALAFSTWRTISEASDDVTDALVLLVELWADRCAIGFIAGRLEVVTRYAPLAGQEHRLDEARPLLAGLVPWAVPMRRAGKPPGREGSWIAFERIYPTGFFKGWN